MPDILELQRDFNSFWDWTANSMEKLVEKSPNHRIITGNLICHSNHYSFDFSDIVNICLFDEILKTRGQAAFLLPDNKERRSTMLFATLLILQWFRLKQNDIRNSKLLFVGSPLLLRHYFKDVKYAIPLKTRNSILLEFSNFFPKTTYFSGGDSVQSSQESDPWEVHIPQILCHYSPTNPNLIINVYKPDCIVINFGNEQKDDPWILPLVQIARESNIPLIALVQNSLSKLLSVMQDLNLEIFYWPRNPNQIIPTENTIKSQNIDLKNYLIDFYETSPIMINPIIIQSSNHRLFLKAYINLNKAQELSKNDLTLTAVKMGIRYLRLLEELSIPLKIYESECGNYWGLKRISSMKEAFDKFLTVIEPSYPDVFDKLAETSSQLDRIYDDFYWVNNPEIWITLNDILKQTVPENEIWILVFKAKARQKLFELSYLLTENITSDTLEKRQIFITCLKDFQKTLKRIKTPDIFDEMPFKSENKQIRSIIIGLPSKQSDAYLEEIFLQNSADILHYSHLNRVFEKKVDTWNSQFAFSLEFNVKMLSKSLKSEFNSKIPLTSKHLLLKKSAFIISKNIKSVEPQTDKLDTIEQSESIKNIVETDLLHMSDLDDDEESYLFEDSSISNETTNRSNEILINTAIEIQFESGKKALFSPNQILTVINQFYDGQTSQSSTTEKQVIDIQVGNKILFIRGQKRQNLYDLLITRIHGHPSVEIKLKMIKRWHEEFRISFKKEKFTNGLTLDDLLRSLRNRGSQINSSQTLALWLTESTIAPSDREDLKRLSEELNMAFVKKYYAEIYKAAQRIRGIHVGFANRLNHWLLNQAAGVVNHENDLNDYIDEEMGITLQDFKDSLMILSVVSVESKTGLFYRDDLGKLEG
jgi:hypothetical protein